MLRYTGDYDSALSDEEVIALREDNDFTDGEGPWTDLLAGATVVRVEWSRNGLTWSGVDIDLTPDASGRNWLRWNPPQAIIGTEYLVRFVIGGVTYGPISIIMRR